MQDFIGFTYNGKHCINDFGIYRVSNGSRYDDNLVPSMNDKTADVPGGDGQYFFQTTHKNRQFSISIAFDHLTEQKYREMRTWLDGKEIHDLIFDEAPYKVYSAKVTGTPQLKTLCFDEGGQRVYKGEGTIQFTCYYPYAHTPKDKATYGYQRLKQYTGQTWVRAGFLLCPNHIFYHGQVSTVTVTIRYCCYKNNQWTSNFDLDLTTSRGVKLSDFQESDPEIEAIYIEQIKASSNLTEFNITIAEVDYEDESYELLNTYVYTDTDCFESQSVFWGRDINSYSLNEYPNKKEWISTFGLQNGIIGCQNFGDLPAPFLVAGKIPENKTKTPLEIAVGDCAIFLVPPYDSFDLYWDSQNGMVAKQVEGKYIPIAYTGKSYGTMPLGTCTHSYLKNLNLRIQYRYWYY